VGRPSRPSLVAGQRPRGAGAPGAERYTRDPRLLQRIELHDEAYWLFRSKRAEPGAVDGLLASLPDTELYVRFVELDATTEGKDPTSLVWLRNELAVRGLLPAGRPPTPGHDTDGSTIFLIQWETEAAHQERFAEALGPAPRGTPGAEEWPHAEVLRRCSGARVVLFGRAAMPSDVVLLRGGTFAQRIADQIDQTGVRLLEARLLESGL
jgi:hypothetical protein